MQRSINSIMYKKHIVLLIMGLWASVALHAQREPQYTQYVNNIGSFNPAYVGTVDKFQLIGLYRTQWVDIPDAPKTIRFGANIPFANEKGGLGFNIVNDELGPTTQTIIDVAYSYQVNVSEETKLSFGLNAGGSLYDVDFSRGNFQIDNEPLLSTQQLNEFYPIVGAGVFLYAEDWYVGLSAPNFLSGIVDGEINNVIDDEQQFNAIAGIVFDLSESVRFKPAVLANYTNGLPVNVNLSANFLIRDTFTFGASYRLDNAVSGLAGFQITPGIFAGYAYDYNTNALGEFSQGSHEVILKFAISKKEDRNNKKKANKAKGKPKQIDSPRFF